MASLPTITESYVMTLASFVSIGFVLSVFGKKIKTSLSKGKDNVVSSLERSEAVLKESQNILDSIKKELEQSRSSYEENLKKIAQNTSETIAKAEITSQKFLDERIVQAEKVAKQLKDSLLKDVKKELISNSVQTSKMYLSTQSESLNKMHPDYAKYIVDDIREVSSQKEDGSDK